MISLWPELRDLFPVDSVLAQIIAVLVLAVVADGQSRPGVSLMPKLPLELCDELVLSFSLNPNAGLTILELGAEVHRVKNLEF